MSEVVDDEVEYVESDQEREGLEDTGSENPTTASNFIHFVLGKASK